MIFFKHEDEETKKAYSKWREPALLKQICLISFVTGLLYLLMSFLDYFIAPSDIYPFVFLLHFFLLPSLAFSITFLALNKKYYTLMIRLLVFASIVATTGHTLIMMQLHYYSSYYSEVYLIIFWVFTVSGLPFKHAIYTTITMIIISALGVLYTPELLSHDVIMHIFWMIASFSFGCAGAYILASSNKTIFLQQKELHQVINNKNVLLKELAHRVKNNLQIVSSILYSQSKKVSDAQTKKIFDDSIQTIKAMGMIHEKLFTSQNLDSINFKEYIQNLINLVSQNVHKKKLHFSFESENIIINIENAIPLGLIVNEILTNSLKYAIPKNNQDIFVKIGMTKDKDNKIHLYISDNGNGIDFQKQKKGFGTQLIHSIVGYQLKGEIKCFNDNGLHYNINFTDSKKSPELVI